MSSNVHETIPIALRDISDGRGSSRTSIRHTTDGADGPADTQLEGDASTVDSVRREDMLGGFDGVGNEDSGPANNAEDITNDPRVMELARRVYDELRMYVPIASGMENQIRRNGLLPKKTLDGDNFIRMTRTRNYYRDERSHTADGALIIHEDDEDPYPGTCAAFIHPPYESQTEYRGEKDQKCHASTTLLQLANSAKTCGFCSVLHQGIYEKRERWILLWAEHRWADALSAEQILQSYDHKPWIEQFWDEVAGGKVIDESAVKVTVEFPKGKPYVCARLHLPPWSGAPQVSPDSHLPGPRMRNLINLEFYTAPGSPSPWTAFGQAQHIQDEVYCEASVRRLKTWLSICEKDHGACRSPSDGYLPKRLLEISLAIQQPTVCKRLAHWLTCGLSQSHDTDETDPDGTFQVKLVDTRPGQVYHYAALSHMWAKTHPLRTTTDTLRRHQQPISVHQLPDAFRDAAILTLSLGLEYIWIDSLCIVQDDLSDWNAQAPQMHSIYASAEVVIAAHGSDLGMVKAPPQPIQDTERPTDPPIFCRESTEDLHKSFFSDPKGTTSWFGRAWCMQERIFARRILHFGGLSEEMVFECNTTIACECGGMPGHDAEAGNDGFRTLKAEMASDLTALTSTLTPEPLFLDLWKFYIKACENYTARGLTYCTDVLPAVSSLMGRLRPYLGAYYAGLWEYNLLLGLQWEALDTRKSLRHSEYVAPTFSWASRSGAVIWYIHPDNLPTQLSHDFAEIVSVQCNAATEDPYGRVSAGSITLVGHITTMTVANKHMQAPDGRVRLFKDDTPECYVTLDSMQDYESLEAGATVACLDIMRDKSESDSSSVYVSGLVLVSIESPDIDKLYKRVGFSTMLAIHFNDALREEVNIV